MTYRPNLTEVFQEYTVHDPRLDADGCTLTCNGADCIVCANYDNLRCASEAHCESDVDGARIGEWLGARDDIDEHCSARAFFYPSMPTTLFCEDCADKIDDPATVGDIFLDGDVGGYLWEVYVDNSVTDGKRFCANVCTVDLTHAVSWETELGMFATLAAAECHARTHAERLAVDDLDWEVAAGLHSAPADL